MAFNAQAAKKAGYTDQEIQSYLQGNQNQPKAPILNGLLQLGGAVGGQMAGENAGAAAGALVPGLGETGITEAAGGYGGGIAGGGLGAGAGDLGANLIRKYLLGDQTVNPNQMVPSAVQAGQAGAASSAIGGPIVKGLGILSHIPQAAMEGIAPATKDIPFLQGVNQILAKSNKTINMNDVTGILGQFEKNVLPTFTNKLMGPEAQAAYDTLKGKITDAAGGMAKTASTDIRDAGKAVKGPLTVPIKDAQTIKQSLYQLAKEFYGQQGPVDAQVQKGVAKLLKGAIDTAEPGVKLPNTVAGVATAVPNTLAGLTQILPGAAGKAVSTVAGLPGGVIGKAFPLQPGPVGQQFLPRILQMILMGNQADQSQQ